MPLSKEKLNLVLKNSLNTNEWFDALSESLPESNITTDKRISAFLAQTYHESGGYKVLRENLNYSAKGLLATFPKYFNEQSAFFNERKPEQIANIVYSNRMGNGQKDTGDGWRFRGAGLIQLTGKQNYINFQKDCYLDEIPLNDLPNFCTTPAGAVMSACWFWRRNNLNVLADDEDLKLMTKKINGGYIGLDDRIHEYVRIKAILTS